MAKRILTAIIGLIIVGGLLGIGKVGFLGLWFVVGGFLLYEWAEAEKLPTSLVFCFTVSTGLLWFIPLATELFYGWVLGVMAFLGGWLLFMEPKAGFFWAYRIMGAWFWIGGGWGSLLGLFWKDYAPEKLLAFLSLVWVADTSAYFVGKFFGRHRILPRISPNKTWEGFGAALVGTAVWGYWAVGWAGSPLTGWAGVGIGALTAVVGFFGDAWESAWKRALDLKDSGTFLPGHGGFLDRVDALLWVAPFWYLFHKLL